MNKNQKETTLIRVSIATRLRLARRGTYGESMDDIINRLIFMAESGTTTQQEAKFKEDVENKMVRSNETKKERIKRLLAEDEAKFMKEVEGKM